MPTAQDVIWFKTEFQPAIARRVAGTPFTVDMLTAFACQETGEIWPALRRKGLPTARILELCVGDTIDVSPTGGRRAFPRNRAELVGAPGGDRMFALARQALVEMAEQIPGYRGAAARPDKFCHGFGIFQLDLQFFRTEPEYFVEKRYADFDTALLRCLKELAGVLRKLGLQDRKSLTDMEMAAVAIAYNTGRFNPAKGLKQGFFDGTRFYGENFHAFLQLAKANPVPMPEPVAVPAPRSVSPMARAVAPPRARPARTRASARSAKPDAVPKPKRTPASTASAKPDAGSKRKAAARPQAAPTAAMHAEHVAARKVKPGPRAR